MNTTGEIQLNIIRKKSSFLRDDSYRIFHIAKNTLVQHNEQIPLNHPSTKIPNRNVYIRRQQALIDIQPKLHSNSHRRQIACCIVLLALTIIMIIMVYVIIMSVKHIQWTYSNQ